MSKGPKVGNLDRLQGVSLELPRELYQRLLAGASQLSQAHEQVLRAAIDRYLERHYRTPTGWG